MLKQLQALLLNQTGQDLIEYALMAGLLAVSVGALLPNLAPTFSSIFSRITSAVALAAG